MLNLGAITKFESSTKSKLLLNLNAIMNKYYWSKKQLCFSIALFSHKVMEDYYFDLITFSILFHRRMYYSAQEYLDFMERVNQLTIQNQAIQRDNEILAKYRSNELNSQSRALQESRNQRWNQSSRAKIPQEKENWHPNEPESTVARCDPNPSFSQFEKCIEKQIKMSV